MSLKEVLGKRKTKTIDIEGEKVTIKMIDMNSMFDAIEVFGIFQPLIGGDKSDMASLMSGIKDNKQTVIDFIAKMISEDSETVEMLGFDHLVEILMGIYELNQDQLFLGLARAEKTGEKLQNKTGSTPYKPSSAKATA